MLTAQQDKLIQEYKDQFTKHYGHNRVTTKPRYQDGGFVGWIVKVDDGGGLLMSEQDIREAIAGFKAGA